MTRTYGQSPTCHPDRPYKGRGLCDRCYANDRYARQGHKWHGRSIKRKFGLTPDEYNAMLSSQGGKCALCGRADEERRMAVDHDHETGTIRGLLCKWCNRGIGLLQDDPDLLRQAAEYIERNRCSPSRN